jgi:hypothetical protein
MRLFAGETLPGPGEGTAKVAKTAENRAKIASRIKKRALSKKLQEAC